MSIVRESGLAALQSGDIQTAITQLETAIQQDPNGYQAHLYLGSAYGQAGRSRDAIHILTAAVKLEPANAQARYNLGIAMDQAGYRDHALQALQQALQLQPNYPQAQEAVQCIQQNPAHGNDGFGAPLPPQNRSANPQSSPLPPTGMSYAAPRDAVYGQPPIAHAPPLQAQPPLYAAGAYAPQPQSEEVGLAAYGTAPPTASLPPTYSQAPGVVGNSPSSYDRPSSEPYPESCPEANQALGWGVASLFIFILFPIPILRAIRAKSIMKQNPHMTGQGKANAAIVLGLLAIPWQMAMVQLVHFLKGQ